MHLFLITLHSTHFSRIKLQITYRFDSLLKVDIRIEILKYHLTFLKLQMWDIIYACLRTTRNTKKPRANAHAVAFIYQRVFIIFPGALYPSKQVTIPIDITAYNRRWKVLIAAWKTNATLGTNKRRLIARVAPSKMQHFTFSSCDRISCNLSSPLCQIVRTVIHDSRYF